MIIVWIVIAVIVVILIFMFIGNYNGLVGLRNAVKTAWAQIDVQLKRRYDLIPNLVETVKGYKNFESSTLQAVTNARSAAQAGANASPAIRADLEGALSGALSRLMVVVEAYPDLKVQDKVQPCVYRSQSEYVECPNCHRIYWKGTHWQAMLERLKGFAQQA